MRNGEKSIQVEKWNKFKSYDLPALFTETSVQFHCDSVLADNCLLCLKQGQAATIQCGSKPIGLNSYGWRR